MYFLLLIDLKMVEILNYLPQKTMKITLNLQLINSFLINYSFRTPLFYYLIFRFHNNISFYVHKNAPLSISFIKKIYKKTSSPIKGTRYNRVTTDRKSVV